jgi:endonuclease/exonuclease/phosphatase family metal-dependent hydrolase
MLNLISWLGMAIALAFFSGRNTEEFYSGKKKELIVMTYNVHHCNPPSKAGIIDMDAVSAVISQQAPDLVALQEIDVHTKRSNGLDEAQALAHKTGLNYYFGKAIDFDGGEYGVAILSRYTISHPVVYRLPSDANPSSEPRVMLSVRVTFPGGDSIRFGSTHLDVSNRENRMLQMQTIADISSNSGIPCIIAGDFNDTAGSGTIQLLDQEFTRTCQACAFTIPVEKPDKTIDFIAFRPKEMFQVEKHQVIDEKYASDHLPVVARLKYKKGRLFSGF